MPVIKAQPSPFGHLTRERHIDSITKSLRRKENSEKQHLAWGASQGCAGAVLGTEPDATGLQRSLTQAANACATRGHSCSTEAWIGYEMEPSGRKCQGAPDLPPGPSACKRCQEGELSFLQHQEAGTHPGLHLLASAHQFCITSKAECHGLVSNFQRRSYVISGAADEGGLLVATEEYNDCCFHLCGPARSCHLCLQDQEGHIVLWLCRPFRLGLGCLRCCRMEIMAFTSDNQLVGTVRQRCHIFSHLLEVCDAQGLATMKIHGSWVPSRCFSEQEFQVLSSTDHVVANIWKKWPGFKEERNMDHESFGVDLVAADLSIEERTCLLAAAFLLNFMFFEVS